MQRSGSFPGDSQETPEHTDGTSDSAALQALRAQLRAKTLECEERARAGQAQADELGVVRQEARQARARLQVVSRSLEDAHMLLHTEQSKYEALKVVFDVQQRALDDAQAMMLSVRAHLKGLAHDNDVLQRKALHDELRMNALSTQNSKLLAGMRTHHAAAGRSSVGWPDDGRSDSRLPQVLKALVAPGRQHSFLAAFDHGAPPQSIAPDARAAPLDGSRSWQDALQELLHARLPGQDSPTHHSEQRYPTASESGGRGHSEAVANDLQLTELLRKLAAQQDGAAQLPPYRPVTPPLHVSGRNNSGSAYDPPSTSSLISDSVLASLASAHAPSARGGPGSQDGDLHALLSNLISGLTSDGGRGDAERGGLTDYASQVLLAADAGAAGAWSQEMARAAGVDALTRAEFAHQPSRNGSGVVAPQDSADLGIVPPPATHDHAKDGGDGRLHKPAAAPPSPNKSGFAEQRNHCAVLSNVTDDHASDLSDESHTVKSTQMSLKRSASDSMQSPNDKRGRQGWHPDDHAFEREQRASADALEMLVEAAFHAPQAPPTVSPPSSGAGSPKADRHPAEAPAPPVPGKHGRRINPRKGIPMHVMATYSLLRLRNHRGNLGEIAAEIEQNEIFRKHLDWTPRPGTKTYPRWKDALVGCFKPHRYPHLTKTDQRKEGLTVYALDENKIPQKSRLSQAMLAPSSDTSTEMALTRHALMQPA